jgi:hypothetical protein
MCLLRRWREALALAPLRLSLLLWAAVLVDRQGRVPAPALLLLGVTVQHPLVVAAGNSRHMREGQGGYPKAAFFVWGSCGGKPLE